MKRFLLFIWDPNSRSSSVVYEESEDAKAALYEYVRQHWRRNDILCPTEWDLAIREFFADGKATYTIAQVRQSTPLGPREDPSPKFNGEA